MWLLWLGVLLLILKVSAWGPFAEFSWYWVLVPFGLSVIWFEWVERLLGRDRQGSEEVQWERRRRDRIKERFQKKTTRK